MKYDLMIFDKDGTLIEFDAFWVKVAENALSDVINDLSVSSASPELLLEAIGVKNGITDINSVLCKGTYEEIGETVYSVLIKKEIKMDPDYNQHRNNRRKEGQEK